jgi:hypothetical protein
VDSYLSSRWPLQLLTIATPNTDATSYLNTLNGTTNTGRNNASSENNATLNSVHNTTVTPYNNNVHTHIYIVNKKIEGPSPLQITAYIFVVILAIFGIAAFFKWRAKEKQRRTRQQQRPYPPEYDEIYSRQPLTVSPSAPAATASNLNLSR